MAEGGGLLNRCTVVKLYRGFESPSLRQFSLCENWRPAEVRRTKAGRTLKDWFDRSACAKATAGRFSYPDMSAYKKRRDGREAEGARLESVYRGNSIGGSNPPLSANFCLEWCTRGGFEPCEAMRPSKVEGRIRPSAGRRRAMCPHHFSLTQLRIPARIVFYQATQTNAQPALRGPGNTT